MEESLLNRLPRLSDAELERYVHQHGSYRTEVVEAAAAELAKRGRGVSKEQMQSIRTMLTERDTGRPPPGTRTEDDLRRAAAAAQRLRRAAWLVLVVGVCAALTIYLLAKPEIPNPLGDMMDQKRSVRDLQGYGGKVNTMLVQFLNWFETLWHGRPLGTIVALTTFCTAAGLARLARRHE